MSCDFIAASAILTTSSPLPYYMLRSDCSSRFYRRSITGSIKYQYELDIQFAYTTTNAVKFLRPNVDESHCLTDKNVLMD